MPALHHQAVRGRNIIGTENPQLISCCANSQAESRYYAYESPTRDRPISPGHQESNRA